MTVDFSLPTPLIHSKHRFYINEALAVSQRVSVDKKLSHYMLNVLRLKSGSPVIVFNGSENEFMAELIIQKKNKVALWLHQQRYAKHKESTLPLYLALSLVRTERFDWAIQKATELGVHGIYPIRSKFTQVRLANEKIAKRLEHWKAVSIAACEQSGRVCLPKISSVYSLENFLQAYNEHCIIAFSPIDSDQIPPPKGLMAWLASQRHVKMRKVICLIGPEGGWADEEVILFQHYGIVQLSLGQRILRSETAAMTSLSIVQSCLGDLN